MQKVSKQSLAMLALSILLAISIALTFTFAAGFSDSKNAEGTINFAGSVALTMTFGEGTGGNNGFESGDGSTGSKYTFTMNATSTTTLAEIADELANVKFGLTAESQLAYVGVKVTITGQTVGDTGVIPLVKGTGADFSTEDTNFATGITWKTTAQEAASSEWNLGNFVVADADGAINYAGLVLNAEKTAIVPLTVTIEVQANTVQESLFA